MSREGYVPVRGSEREPLAGARLVGPADPDEYVEVTVVLQPRGGDHRHALTEAAHGGERLSREDLASRFGADPHHIDRVKRFAADNGLDVTWTSAARRSVALGGTADDLAHAFGVRLGLYEHESGATYRGREGAVHVPKDLEDAVVAVLGLDDRQQAHPHMRVAFDGGDEEAQLAGAAARPFTPVQVAELYDFPAGVDGSGQCIALIELGGGFRKRDITSYFKALGLRAPTVTAVSVDHGVNHPTTPSSADGEVMLDIDVAGGVAPGASLAVYFAPNSDRGFVDAITQAVHDDQHKPSVISISWGAAESNWTKQTMTVFDQAFQEAAAIGVTVCAAAGDNGSSDGVNDGKAHVDFPASNPYVLGCGGTHVQAGNGGITSETVWQTHGATGGGVSAVFAPPDWQAGADVPPPANPAAPAGRGVPDVAGDADPTSGYHVRVDGQDQIVGGTSAVAPLWAGLIARINQARGGQPAGYITPQLYLFSGLGAFRDITEGSNGAYRARPGWDACTGWGSPVGQGVLDLLGWDTPERPTVAPRPGDRPPADSSEDPRPAP